jgi:hypothetical protein
MPSSTFFAPLMLLAGVFSATPALAQDEAKITLREGDHILSLGNVRSIFTQIVNDNGLWFCEVSTDNGDNNRDGGILRNGFLSIQESTLLSAPPSAKIQSFIDVSVNSLGHLGWPLDMKDTAGGNNDDNGLFWNTILLAQEGSAVNAPEVSVNTGHKRFKAAKINDLSTLLLTCDIDDPDISGTVENALIWYRTDGMGTVTERRVLLKETDQILFGATVRSVGGNTHAIALNNNDDWLAQIQMTGPAGGADTAFVINNEIVLREGAPAFQEGRTWNDLSNPELDLNDFGDFVANVQMNVSGPDDGLDNSVIVRNGEKFVQEGDSFPSIAPYAVIRFDSAPVYIGNSGDVYWYALINSPDANANQAYFRNQDVIIQQGQFIEGDIVTSVRTGTNAFHVSPNGRYWLGEVGLQSVGETLLLADFGLVVPIPGCFNNPGTVAKVAGSSITGGSLTFGMDDAQAIGVTPFLYFSTRPSIMGSECGINTSLGELLIGLGGSRVGRLFGTPWNGSTPSLINLNLPADPSLVDVEFYGQGLWWDIAGTSGAERFRLTNGFRMEVGAP